MITWRITDILVVKDRTLTHAVRLDFVGSVRYSVRKNIQALAVTLNGVI